VSLGVGAVGVLAVWICVSLVWFGGRPPDRALDAPGRVGVEFVVVEERLSVSVRGRGVAEPVSVVEVGSPSFEGPGSVTAPPVVGRVVGEGDAVLEVWDRPVIVLEGRVPLGRSLWPGDSGPDVQGLEDALVRLGLLVSADGVVGVDTADAVAALHERLGFARPVPPSGLAEEILAARKVLDKAHEIRDRAVEDAREALGAERDRLETELDRVESDQQRQALEAESGRIAATRSLEAARAAHAAVVRCLAGGGDPCGDLVAAEEDVRLAEIDMELFEHSSDQRTGELAERHRTAEAALAALAGDVRLVPGVADSEEVHRDAHAALDGLLKRQAGWISDEGFVMVPDLPATVAGPQAEVGTDVSGLEGLRFASGLLDIELSVSALEARPLREGLAATVSRVSDGRTAEATVASVEQAEDVSRSTVTLLLDNGHGLAAGDAVIADIVTVAAERAVPVVPVAAVTLDSAGRHGIDISNADGSTRRVVVQLGLQADGLVEILDADSGIAAGDIVVYGAKP